MDNFKGFDLFRNLIICNVAGRMNNQQFLAPQAYTKEVLRNALLWLESQPEQVKKQLNSNDQVVSFFLRAKRDPNFQAPTLNTKTIEQFHTDLKSLAESLKQFEGSDSAIHPPNQNAFSPPAAPAKPTHPTVPSAFSNPNPIVPSLPVQQQTFVTHPSEASRGAGFTSIDALDPKSREVIQTVCQRLNLSDPDQALRMLIILGAEKLKVLD